MLDPKLHEHHFLHPSPDTLLRSLNRLPQVDSGQSIYMGRNRLARGSSSRADPAHGRARTLTTSESFVQLASTLYNRKEDVRTRSASLRTSERERTKIYISRLSIVSSSLSIVEVWKEKGTYASSDNASTCNSQRSQHQLNPGSGEIDFFASSK